MSTTPRRRRLVPILGLVAALVLPTAAALAAPSTHIQSHQVDLGAEFATDEAIVSFKVTVSDDLGPSAAIQVWTPAERFFAGEPPTLVSGEADLVAGTDDTSISGTVELYVLDTGAAAGTVTVDTTLEPNGPAQTSSTTQTGNHKLRSTQTVQPMLASGTVTFSGSLGAFDLADAYAVNASALDIEQFSNDPASTVTTTDFVGMFMTWEVDGFFIMVAGNADRLLAYVDVAVILPDGTILNGGQDHAIFGRRAILADVPLASAGQGLAATGGTLAIRADVTGGERTSSVMREGDARTRLTIQQLVATGSLQLSLDDGTSLSLDFADGEGSFFDWSERFIDGGR